MDNVIFNDMDESIGYYKDLAQGYKEMIEDEVKLGDYERAQSLIEEAQEIDEYKEYEGLLVLSENNGMGFTCRPYKETKNDM